MLSPLHFRISVAPFCCILMVGLLLLSLPAVGQTDRPAMYSTDQVAMQLNISPLPAIKGEPFQLVLNTEFISDIAINSRIHAWISLDEEGVQRSTIMPMLPEGDKLVTRWTDSDPNSFLIVAPSTQFRKINNAVALAMNDTTATSLHNSTAFPVLMNPDLFEEAIVAHPNNFALYRFRWEGLIYDNEQSAMKKIRRETEDLRVLDLPDEEAMYSLIAGYCFLDEMEVVDSLLTPFIEASPNSPWWTGLIPLLFNSIDDEHSQGDSVRIQMLWQKAQAMPTSWLAQALVPVWPKRNRVDSSYFEAANTALRNNLFPLFDAHYFVCLSPLSDKDMVTTTADLLSYAYGHEDFSTLAWVSHFKASQTLLDRLIDVGAMKRASLFTEEGKYYFQNEPRLGVAFALHEATLLTAKGKYRQAVHLALECYLNGAKAGVDTARSIWNRHMTSDGSFEGVRLNAAIPYFSTQTPYPAPRLAGRNVNGGRINLRDLQGTPVALLFADPIRGTQLDFIQSLAPIARQIANANAQLIVVTPSIWPELKGYTELAMLDLPIITDLRSFEEYEIAGTPAFVILDKRHHVRLFFTDSDLLGKNDVPLLMKALAQEEIE